MAAEQFTQLLELLSGASVVICYALGYLCGYTQ